MNTITQQLQLIKQQQRLGLMTHVVIGYPSLADTVERVKIMAAAGVDFVELQMPFSDPLADGPAISTANQAALANGVTVTDCINLAKTLSQQVEIPLLFMGYYNTIYHYGIKQFVTDAAQAGIQGFIFPDFPFDEEPYDHFLATAQEYDIPVIQVVSPASTEARLQKLGAIATGLVYCVARFGVTGAKTDVTENTAADLTTYLQRVRKYVTLPLAVGFGIATPSQVAQLRGKADIAVIGSALLKIPTPELTNFIHTLCA